MNYKSEEVLRELSYSGFNTSLFRTGAAWVITQCLNGEESVRIELLSLNLPFPALPSSYI